MRIIRFDRIVIAGGEGNGAGRDGRCVEQAGTRPLGAAILEVARLAAEAHRLEALRLGREARR